MERRRRLRAPTTLGLAALAGLGSTALPAVAQAARDTTPGRIIGRVVDHGTGAAIEGVAIRLDHPDARARVTNAAGVFVLPSVPPGVHDVRIEHIAYGELTHLVNVPAGQAVDLELRLVPRAIAVDSIVVRAWIRNPVMDRSGYYERKRAGWGWFVDGPEAGRGAWASDIVRMVPRVEVRQGRRAFQRAITMRDGRYRCVPELYVDGFFIPSAQGRIDDYVLPGDVEAIEVYRGTETPPRFISRPGVRTCGAIAVWTRR